MSGWLLWGCGRDQVDLDGWVGSDVDNHGQHHVGDILDGLPWPDGHGRADESIWFEAANPDAT